MGGAGRRQHRRDHGDGRGVLAGGAERRGGGEEHAQRALIGVVVLVYALYWSNRGGVEVEPGWRPRAAFVWRTFPKFVLGFIAVSAVATSGLLAKAQITSLGNLSMWAFLLCFAGVGLNFDLREIARSGVRPLVVAALGLVVVAACSLGLVLLTSGWLRL